jgi:hypothetical protein
MSIRQFSDWLSDTPVSQAIQITSWAIPAIQTVHIIALAALFACALLVALRIAGRGFSSEPLHLLARRYVSAIWMLLLVLLVTGTLLVVAEPGRTITNPVFYAKMTMLVLAIAITLWLAQVSRRELAVPSTLHVVAGAVSMLLWSCIIVAGRFIAYVESY